MFGFLRKHYYYIYVLIKLGFLPKALVGDFSYLPKKSHQKNDTPGHACCASLSRCLRTNINSSFHSSNSMFVIPVRSGQLRYRWSKKGGGSLQRTQRKNYIILSLRAYPFSAPSWCFGAEARSTERRHCLTQSFRCRRVSGKGWGVCRRERARVREKHPTADAVGAISVGDGSFSERLFSVI